MRTQIAFDYLMVFIFVLLVFTIVFYSISKQRVEIASQQSFSQLQLVGQTIAAEITEASQSGNGYSATLPLPGSLALLDYNVSITKYGAVIVSSNTFGQEVTAYSPSYVSYIASNASYLSASGDYYTIPTYTGTGFMTLQNSYGVVCVDYACPSSFTQPSQLATYAHSVYALRFNGANTRLYEYPFNSLGPKQTVSMWIDPAQGTGTSEMLYDEGSASSGHLGWISYQSNAITVGTTGTAGYSCTGAAQVPSGTWSLVTFTFDGSSLDLYIDGNSIDGCSVSGISGSASSSISVGGPSYPSAGYAGFNGLIANVQAYGAALSGSQVGAIWASGIYGSPSAQQYVSGWWPLNGNANDYSGSGYNLGFNGSGQFAEVTQVSAQVLNYSGTAEPGLLVAFSSGVGNRAGAWSYNGIADGNGIATAFVTQGSYAASPILKATAFSGNYSMAKGLAAWWPLNEGQGSIAYDGASSSSAPGAPNGNVIGASWASPNHVLSLDGRSGYVQVPDAVGLQLSTETVTGWIYIRSPGPGYRNFLFSKQGAYDVGACGSSLSVCFYDWGGTGEHVAAANLATNTWYMLTATVSGGTETVYVNGVPVLTGPATASSQSFGPRIGYGVQQQFLNGSVSNVQVYGAQLSQQQILGLYQEGIAGAPLPASLVAWWPLDGDTNDYSGSGYNGTAYGGISYSAYLQTPLRVSHVLSAGFGGNSYASGSGSGLDLQQLTVSAWINPSPARSCDEIFSTMPQGGSSGYELRVNATSSKTSFDYASSNGLQLNTFAGTAYPAGAWSFIAATFSGGVVDLYVNGVMVNSTTNPNAAILYLQGGWAIGSMLNGGNCGSGNVFMGQMSNVQVYGTVLTGAQIAGLYSHGAYFPPSVSAPLSGWWPLNGNAKDYSAQSDGGTSSNIVYYAQNFASMYSTPSMSGYGVYLNGNSEVMVANSVSVPGPAFSVSAWAYPVSLQSGREEIVGQNNAYALAIGKSGNSEADFLAYAGGTWMSVQSQKSLQPDSWYLLTGVYNSTRMSLYVDGQLAATSAVSGSFSNPGTPTVIGASEAPPYNTYYFNGTIADVQVYNAQLSPQQAAQLYIDGMPLSVPMGMPMGGNP